MTRHSVSRFDPVDDAGWVREVSQALGLYYDYDGPHTAAEAVVVVEEIGRMKRFRAVVQETVKPFLRSLRDDFDCDPDAHRYGTTCRCCRAGEVLRLFEGETG